jgi:hypothetical protein
MYERLWVLIFIYLVIPEITNTYFETAYMKRFTNSDNNPESF